MSAGNACAAIGLANTSKIVNIGTYTQAATPPPGPESWGPAFGVNGSTFYDRNVLGEDYTVSGGILFPADSGATLGKNARWVSNTSSIAAGTTRVAVSAGGVATADNAAGAYDIFLGALTGGLPANSFFWAFER